MCDLKVLENGAKAGISGYGVYIPPYRIKIEEIAKVWGKNAEHIKKGLAVEEKSVPGMDEDTITISVEAARNAVRHAGIDVKEIGAIFVGSESHPYAVKPTAVVVAEAIETGPNLTASDTEFACKAGTVAIQMCMGMVKSGMIKYGMAIGADTSQSMPGDALEFTASAGGAAFIIGKNDLIAEIEETFSFTTDTADFWRRDFQEFPRHGARFTGEPAYFKHIISAAKGLLEKTGKTVDDFDYVIFHQPNGKFPLKAAKDLGILKEKLQLGLLVEKIGNTYSGSSMLGLASVLDVAKPDERILVVSYGSGAGSDAFSIRVLDGIEKKRNKIIPVKKYLERRIYLDYATYAKFKRKLRLE